MFANLSNVIAFDDTVFVGCVAPSANILTTWPSKWFSPATELTTCLTVAPDVWAIAVVMFWPLVHPVKLFVDLPV